MAATPPRPPKSVIAPAVRVPVRVLPTPEQVAERRQAKAKANKVNHRRADALEKLPSKDIPAKSPKDIKQALELAKRLKLAAKPLPPKKKPGRPKKGDKPRPSKRVEGKQQWAKACEAAGASTELPPMSEYRGGSPMYRQEFCEYIVDLASDYDMVPLEIAAHLGISDVTYKKWVQEYPEFCQAHLYVLTLLKSKYMRKTMRHADNDTGSAALLKWLGSVSLGLTEEQTIKHANPDGTKLEGIRVEFVTATPHPDLPSGI